MRADGERAGRSAEVEVEASMLEGYWGMDSSCPSRRLKKREQVSRIFSREEIPERKGKEYSLDDV